MYVKKALTDWRTGKVPMKLVLLQIERMYNIPPGTMRSAISRHVVKAEKEGKILLVDDQEPTFLAFCQQYRPRAPRAVSAAGEGGIGKEIAHTVGQRHEKYSSAGTSSLRKG